MSGFWLQVREPGHQPRVVTLDREVEAGRDCDGVLLDDPTVSRRHIKLEPAEGGLLLTDLGSANGTLVDGERVSEPLVVRPGTVVRLGETELRVVEGRETTGATEAGASVVEAPGGQDRVSAMARDLNKPVKRGQTGR